MNTDPQKASSSTYSRFQEYQCKHQHNAGVPAKNNSKNVITIITFSKDQQYQ